MEPDAHLDHLRHDVERLLATPDEAMDAPVAACPGWTVAELLVHQAGVYRFATAQLRSEPGDELARFDPPDLDRPVAQVLATTAAELIAALEATDPSEHRPNWADATSAAFWFRRMALETAVHRFDAEAAHTEPAPIAADLGTDGVDELADVFLPHAGRRGITGTGQTVHLHATDPDVEGGEWMFTFTPDGVDVTHEHGKGDMAVRGTGGNLLLFAWNRRPIEVECFGEPDPLTFWAATVRI